MSFSALTLLDLICILICSLSGIIGYKRGAINTLISFGGFIASFVIAWFFSPMLADWLIQSGVLNSLFETINVEAVSQSLVDLASQQNGLTIALMGSAAMSGGESIIDQSLTTMNGLIMNGIAQSISFGIIVLGVSVFCWLLQLVFLGISKIPVVGTINRLAGMLIGLVLAGSVIAVMLWVFSVINLSTSNLIQFAAPIVFKYMGIQ